MSCLYFDHSITMNAALLMTQIQTNYFKLGDIVVIISSGGKTKFLINA